MGCVGMDWAAIVISGVSLAVAIGSLCWAIKSGRASDKLAKDANEKADAANKLSADANVIAKESQRIAEESGVVGKEALTVAQRAELRQSDTSNIHWEGDWQQPGLYTFTNRGDDEALNVRIILTVDEEEVRVTKERVPGGGTVDVECPQAAETFKRERSERMMQELKEQALRKRGAIHGIGAMNIVKYSSHFIGERIDWVTQSGKPGTHDKNYPLSALD